MCNRIYLAPRSGRTEAPRAMLITIVAHVSEAQSSFSGSFESFRYQPARPPIPNCNLCPAHSTGNGCIKSLKVRCAGCFPARIASTMSGASNANRMTRLTNEGPIFSALAISS